MSMAPAIAQLAESLYQGAAVAPGSLKGKEIPGLPKGVRALIALDSSDRLHLLFSPTDISQRSKLGTVQLRELSCSIERWEVGEAPIGDYVDLVCNADRSSPLRMPFCGFCEDVIKTLVTGKTSVPDALVSTFKRWKRFWDVQKSAGLKDEWLKGLFGELVFLKRLLQDVGLSAVGSWTGPEGKDHDFRKSSVAVEVKTTSTDPPTVKIHTLGQLDDSGLDALYMVVIGLGKGASGKSLVDVVAEIEGLLDGEPALQDVFWSKLAQAGYRRDLEGQYRTRLFVAERERIYRVGSDFPRIIGSSFKTVPDRRIKNLRYVLSITGVAELSLTDEDVIRHINCLS